MLERYVKKILASRVYDVANETPLQDARNLSTRLGHQIGLKREDLQPVFSFKLRGAYNKMAGLSAEQRARGVIASSAGNHAQGVALAAERLNMRAHIVMGRNAPSIKVEAVRNLGGHVILHGDTYDDAAEQAHKLAQRHGYTFVHPYDDPDVIAGQGTVGMEIMNQRSDVDAIFVPVGGGGLIAGISAYVKYLRPQTRVIGVEATGSACMAAALAEGRRVRLAYDELDLFADGVAVAQVGKEPFRIARKCVDRVIKVSTDEICAAVKDVFDETRAVAEPAGALALAGLKKYAEGRVRPNQKLVAVVSGANVNFDRLRHIAERAEVGEHREIILGVTIEEEAGSFRRFCQALGKRGVTEFNYRFASPDTAHVYVGLQVAEGETRSDLIHEISAAGYRVSDMTENETAKLHVRHMVGGRAFGRKQELLYRFEFPERAGALMKFLSGLGSRWNITLFHYRNHGAAWGRVLVGFEGVDNDRTALASYLDRIGYRYWEESDNPAYGLFLK
ncbi:MAG: threonine ammonia-lyase, biosynthetic [Pseudomonadales bacterium]|jgi:threonine dehydratase|nr:threonine ammonia-lyase, biosynthetic [Pseudomonadales bacterium]MDP6469483.1 threonine ammonia-lyase, biosynthetic [Pseudomonadales bacterium]MDP6827325.1 threonine ammonia-lyase, biosynthetic [Pseudomonadales bacterium]MDP6971148.1 threonine ammonia-lyase, biosynthetic [Pseudomonadales bacterium]|tara:strand:+ start:4156 stop:5670 length:1515 start_codon:yes stop_codon:yes gene_type:complete